MTHSAWTNLPPRCLPLAEAPAAYEMFQRKADGAVKIMLKPWS
jgi:threonine dehydrogenase-like Zn-dependent dehydrogenase